MEIVNKLPQDLQTIIKDNLCEDYQKYVIDKKKDIKRKKLEKYRGFRISHEYFEDRINRLNRCNRCNRYRYSYNIDNFIISNINYSPVVLPRRSRRSLNPRRSLNNYFRC